MDSNRAAPTLARSAWRNSARNWKRSAAATTPMARSACSTMRKRSSGGSASRWRPCWSRRRPMHPREPANRPTALIVDDDPVMRMLEAETLLQFGFAVREAADGEAALAYLAESPPDLILLDVDMPGIDGFSACRRIRQSWDATDMPVVMVTGMDDVDSITQAYDSGANDFIAKPINWPILGHRARYVLRSAQAAQHLRKLKEKQAAIVRAMPDAIFMMDRDGTFLDYKDGYGA